MHVAAPRKPLNPSQSSPDIQGEVEQTGRLVEETDILLPPLSFFHTNLDQTRWSNCFTEYIALITSRVAMETIPIATSARSSTCF